MTLVIHSDFTSIGRRFEKLIWLETELLNQLELHLELIFVDDGSGDKWL